MSDSATFQEIILQLTNFWKDQGCLVWHPHNVQVGAGTMNPATVLRVLGPEPWNVVYLEPSIRPDDGRFGENPNRMQQHYQIQVILKPDPGNPQELYLRSLESMGIDLDKHDIRFVEDNWEQPALGAWGLGWEVWLDGQEITQFTYFQQAGGVNLDPVSVEITYGMDRIVLAKQRVDSVWEIDFGSGTFYGDLLLQSEIEHCQYYFNVADVEALRKIYDAYEKEAIRCLDKGLVAPAHDFNLKCSFLFNVLDTRGAIGVTERAQFFRRMRKIAGQVSNLYLEQRLRLEYPFLENERWSAPVMDKSAQPVPKTVFSSPQSFVLEIGSEELPAADLESAVRQLELAAREMLDKLRLAYEKMEVQGTPRRLVLQVEALAPHQEDLETVVKGPPLDRAYDPAGVPTKAAEGFARSKGVRTSDLRIVTEGDRRYVAAAVREEGQPAVSLLPAELPSLIAALKFERSMRWNESNISYSRPIRWIVSLFGTQVLPFTYAGVASGRTSRGLRSDDSPDFEIQSASEYGDRLAEQGIMISQRMRQKKILESAATLASQVGGTVKDDSALLSEVANLVEMPTPLLAKFEKRFLALPDDVLVAVMKKHQRYLPVYDGSGEALLPYFIAVRNGGDSHLDIIRDGNEHVIRARFSDAAYFFERDSEQDMAHFLSKLDTLTFQVEVGSMLEKVQRLEKLTSDIADLLEFDEDDKAAAVRAAALSKADLASSLVVEMTSLQGIMGGIYSDMAGEVPAVSQAIAEQYNTISGTNPGLALALSDRVDSLAGLFAAGLAPKGSNDPFALRRAAIQIIENLTANQKSLDLRQALNYAAAYLPLGVTEETLEEVLEFISSRLQTFLQEQGLRTSVVRSVLAQQAHNPYAAATAAKELDEAIKTDAWPQLLDAYSRCVRITRDTESHELNLELFVTEEEKQLWSTYVEASAILDGSVSGLVEAIELLEPAISRFFDGVLVMDDNLDIRQNRLALLQKIAGMTDGIADLSHLEGF